MNINFLFMLTNKNEKYFMLFGFFLVFLLFQTVASGMCGRLLAYNVPAQAGLPLTLGRAQNLQIRTNFRASNCCAKPPVICRCLFVLFFLQVLLSCLLIHQKPTNFRKSLCFAYLHNLVANCQKLR